jgi:DNA-binding CsgD family transcriptional regulator
MDMDMKGLRRIKHICYELDVEGRALIPILLPEIRKIIPACSSTFLWLDNAYNFVNIYDESPYFLSVINKYVNHYLDNGDLKAQRSLSRWLRETKPPVTIATTEQLAYKQFYHSDYYQEILKPQGYHHSLYSGLKHNADPVGIISLHRNSHDRLFSQDDKRNLRELSYLVNQSLKNTERSSKVLPSKSETGLLILDELCLPRHISPRAQQLLFLAIYPEVKKGRLSLVDGELAIPNEIEVLVNKLREEPISDQSLSHYSPTWTVKNAWGSFCFRANWFQRATDDSERLIAITAQYLEPSLYQVMSLCDCLNFTWRQTEIVTGLLKGLTHSGIGDKLNISVHTVTDHVKTIFKKLEIHNRGQLLSSLLSTHVMIAAPNGTSLSTSL